MRVKAEIMWEMEKGKGINIKNLKNSRNKNSFEIKKNQSKTIIFAKTGKI